MNLLTSQGILRDSQLVNVFFHEMLPYHFTHQDRVYIANLKTLIDFFRKIRAEKLEQIRQGNVGIDLYSIILNEGGDVYSLINDEALAEQTLFDDICIIYLAAVSTTQVSVNNLLKYIHMDEYAHVRQKLLTEIDQQLPFDAWDASGAMTNFDQLRQACSYENIQESFDYTMMCFRESLRIEPPVPLSSSHMFTQDVTLCKGTPKELKIRAGDLIHVESGTLHHNEVHWGPEHNKYIPERFDSDSKYFKAPNGKPRHPYSFVPFLGGHRICLGKTLAETVAKKMVAIILKLYELEYVDESLKKTTFAYSIYQLKQP